MKTPISSGAWSPKTSSSNSEWLRAHGVELILLVLAGLAITLLRSYVDWGFKKMPGHHGLEMMAILAVCRLGSTLRWGTLVAGVSAGLFSLAPMWMSGSDATLLGPMTFALQAAAIDLMYRLTQHAFAPMFLLAVATALAHALKPLIKTGVHLATGFPFGSLVHGLGWPLMTHLLFGFAGGLAGVLLYGLARRRRKPKS